MKAVMVGWNDVGGRESGCLLGTGHFMSGIAWLAPLSKVLWWTIHIHQSQARLAQLVRASY